MPTARARLGLLVLACLVGLATAAAASDGEATVSSLTTAEDEVPAGVPVTLGWVLTDADGQPAFHQDARVEVTHEGDTLLAVPPSSGHDYDGVDPYQVAFPSPGSYTVDVAVHDDGEIRQLTYEGTVGPGPDQPLDLRLQAPEHARTGEPIDLGVQVRDADGDPVEDVETALRVQRLDDRFEVLDTRLAGAEASLSYSFARSGSFEIVATAAPLPGGDAGDLAAASATRTITVADPVRAGPAGAPVEELLTNERATAEPQADEAEVFVTFDPYTSVGPHGRLRLGMLALDPGTHEPVPDVSYRVSVLDPDDRLIVQTTDVAGADGFAYLTLSRPDPGEHTVRVGAQGDGWRTQVETTFTVQPPVVATNAGPLFAQPNASTDVSAGEATTFPVRVEDGAGVPLQHGEVDVRWLDRDQIPLVTGKLHVHENGTLPITLAAHEGGGHELQLLPQSLQPAPTPATYGERPGQPPVFEVDVEPAADIDEPVAASNAETDTVPGLSAIASLTVLAVAGRAVLRRA